MIRKIVIALVCCTVLLLGGYVSYRGYKVWKQKHLMKLADQFAAKGDVRNAMLSAQQALRLNPRHLEATRLAARLADDSGSPAAVLWRSRVLELVPGSVEDRLALTRTAVRFGDLRAATNALAGLDPAARQTFEYHDVAGLLAAVGNQVGLAESHMREAVRLQPSNAVAQLGLAVLRLGSTNEIDREEARLSLRRIGSNPTNQPLAMRALKELVNHALRSRDRSNALAFSAELAGREGAGFSDRVLRLEVLQQSESPEWRQALVAAQREAGEGTNFMDKVYQLAEWQMRRTTPRETYAWMKTLPPSAMTNQPGSLIVADCLVALSEWSTLQEALVTQQWQELEFVRHAYLSYALRGQNLGGAAAGEWELAVKGASGQKSALMMLLRLVARWGWVGEGEEVLWAIYNLAPGDPGAFESLTQVLYRAGRTRSLMMVLGQELKRSPANLDVKNNLALAALLLEAWELQPHVLASEVYAKSPTHPPYASTYAFSLHLQGKHREALDVMRALPPAELRNPGLAGYYGVILSGAGDREAARTYLGLVGTNVALPEERKLFDTTRSSL